MSMDRPPSEGGSGGFGGGRPPYRPYGGGPGGPPRRSGPGGPRRGRFIPRRKVCAFCVEHATSIDYKNYGMLRRYLSDRAKIEPRRKTGTCARHQRLLSTALERARHIALLPFASDQVQPAPRYSGYQGGYGGDRGGDRGGGYGGDRGGDRGERGAPPQRETPAGPPAAQGGAG